MKFIQTIRSSVWGPTFYQEVQSQSLKPAVWLLLKLALVGTMIVGAIAYFGILQFADPSIVQKVEDVYPDDLVITIKDGTMSINQEQPYYIKNPLPLAEDVPTYLVIFDGNDELPVDLDTNSTFMLVKETYLIAPGQNEQQQIIPFSKLATSTTIEKSMVVGILDPLKPYVAPFVLGGGAVAILIIAIFGAAFWVGFHMLYVLLPAFIVFLIGTLRHTEMTYRAAYMVSLYASIPVVILFYLLGFIGLAAIPYTYTLLLLGIVFVNLSQQVRAGTPEPSSH